MDEATLTAIRERDAACVSLDDPPRSEAAHSDGWWQSAADRRLLLTAYDRLRAIEAAARDLVDTLATDEDFWWKSEYAALDAALEAPSDAR